MLTLRESAWRISVALVIGGAALITIGALLPWWDYGYDGSEGFDVRNGRITLALGLANLAAPSLRLFDSSAAVRILLALFGSLCGGLVAALGLMELNDIREARNLTAFIQVAVGSGVYVTIVGGFFLLAGSVMGLVPPEGAAES